MWDTEPPVSVVCQNCGKPLGSRTTLCYDCVSDGVDRDAVVDARQGVHDRLERYFVVSSTKCVECSGLHATVTIDGESHTAADFGIESVDEWEREMAAEEAWIRENRTEVEAALDSLEDDWPQTVAAVREHVLRRD